MPAWAGGGCIPKQAAALWSDVLFHFQERLASETRPVQILAQGWPLAHPTLQPSAKSDRGLSWLQKFHQVLQPQEAGMGN